MAGAALRLSVTSLNSSASCHSLVAGGLGSLCSHLRQDQRTQDGLRLLPVLLSPCPSFLDICPTFLSKYASVEAPLQEGQPSWGQQKNKEHF